MLMPREIDLATHTTVSVDELQGAITNEQTGQKSSTVNAVLGGVAGAGLGVLGGIGLVSGVVPGLAALGALGAAMPLMMGSCMAGVGAIAGSYVDLLPISNVWRRR